MKTKIFKYGFWTLGTITLVGIIGYIILLNTFDFFNAPDKKVLTYKCDYEGLRQAEVFRLDGNAVTNPSIHVSVHLDCDNHEKIEKEELIFTAGNGSIGDSDVKIKWVTFDTLKIEFKKELRIFTQREIIEFPDSTLNLHVTYTKVD